MEANSRYLGFADNSTPSPFLDFLKDLGKPQPSSLPLSLAIEAGWLRPALAIALPADFISEWRNFPSLPRGHVRPEFAWATHIWGLLSGDASPTAAGFRGALQGRWYRHFLEIPEYWVTARAKAHSVGGLPKSSDYLVEHPRRPNGGAPRLIFFFRYWEALRLIDFMAAGRTQYAEWNLPSGHPSGEQVLASLRGEREITELLVAGVAKRWAAREGTFEWVSLVRTAEGIWNRRRVFGPTSPEGNYRRAVRALRAEIGLSDSEIRHQIRDHLLVLWSEWAPRAQAPGRLSGPLQCLRRDIFRSVQFLASTSRKRIDLDDEFWGYPRDRQRRLWAPLPEALDFEGERFKREFAQQAGIYLTTFNSVAPKPLRLGEGRIQSLVRRGWGKSSQLRRFIISFGRLHRHLRPRQDEEHVLLEETPMEFLILAVLAAELLLPSPPGSKKRPSFMKLVLDQAKASLVRTRTTRVEILTSALEKYLAENGSLYDLPRTRRNPFASSAKIGGSSKGISAVLRCYSNFYIARNYAAHHDCLDGEILNTEMGKTLLEAVLVVVLQSLIKRSYS